jgi:hypothetical protein
VGAYRLLTTSRDLLADPNRFRAKRRRRSGNRPASIAGKPSQGDPPGPTDRQQQRPTLASGDGQSGLGQTTFGVHPAGTVARGRPNARAGNSGEHSGQGGGGCLEHPPHTTPSPFVQPDAIAVPVIAQPEFVSPEVGSVVVTVGHRDDLARGIGVRQGARASGASGSQVARRDEAVLLERERGSSVLRALPLHLACCRPVRCKDRDAAPALGSEGSLPGSTSARPNHPFGDDRRL